MWQTAQMFECLMVALYAKYLYIESFFRSLRIQIQLTDKMFPHLEYIDSLWISEKAKGE